MDVAVDPSRCSGHARCWSACPEVFDIDETTGKAVVLLSPVPEALHARVHAAHADCPELAVLVSP